MLAAYTSRVAAAPLVGTAAAALGARLQGAQLSTAAATQQQQPAQQAAASTADAAQPKPPKSVGKADPEDAFIFKTHCKGRRVLSEEAKQTADTLRRANFGKPRQHAMHTSAAAFADERSTEDAAQEIVEKGSKRLMQSEEGREELRQGSFDLDATTERIMEEGKKEASPETARRAEDADVKESVKSRVVSGSQTT
ncbi:hypothetical protein ABPG75_011084 [Micractinium tetrahymenae]